MNKFILAFIAINFSFSFIALDQGNQDASSLAIDDSNISLYENGFSSLIFGGKCDKEKEEVIASLRKIIQLIQTGKFNLLLPEFAILKQKADALIKCSKGGLSSESIDPQCVIDHLNAAGKKLKEIISDIMSRKWNDIQKKWGEFIAILEDVKKC